MADMDITQFPIASPLSISDLLYIAIPNALSPTGFSLCKVTSSELADYMLNQIQYATRLNTTHKNVFGAINEILQSSGGGSTMVGGQLTAGQTSITLTDPSIDSSKLFDIFAPWGISPTSEPVIDDINHTITIEFEAQASNINIVVEVKTNGSV